MTSPEDFSRLISQDLLLHTVQKATGRSDAQLLGKADVERATKGIEGFTSIVLRVKVSYISQGDDRSSPRSMVLVVKCMPQAESQLELVKECRVFLREGAFFEKVVPMILDLSKGKVGVPLPACYATVYGGDSDAIYMEDLTESGFRTPDIALRGDGLDLPHCVVSMKRLGRLHGLLVAAEKALTSGNGGWIDILPELSKDSIFYELLPGEPRMPMMGMVEVGLENMLKFSKEVDGIPKEAEASGALERVLKETWKILSSLVRPDSKGRNVLNHGDCWMNNVMFRYEKDEDGVEKPVDAKFVDLQIYRYSHPSIDILYFIYLGTTREFREKHADRLITDYYNSMVDTLDTLEAGPPPLSLQELFDDYHGKYKPFGVILGNIFRPILLLGDFVPQKAEEMSSEMYREFFETGNAEMIRSRFLNDQNYRLRIEENLREFMDMAFPDGVNSFDASPLLI